MSLYEADPAQIPAHCRDLLDALDPAEPSRGRSERRGVRGSPSLEGEHEVTCGLRMSDEADDLTARSRELLDDADAWARIWADTVDQMNRRRRDDAVERRRNERGVGKQIVDIFHGDDSDDLVRPFESVAVPMAQTRYAATGGLESF